jgi:hypothetical protein
VCTGVQVEVQYKSRKICKSSKVIFIEFSGAYLLSTILVVSADAAEDNLNFT